MSGKIKALISIAVSVVVIVAAVFIITSVLGTNQNVTVYDFRIMQKNAQNVRTELVNKTVYLTSEEENYFEFDVYLDATQTVNIYFESSDESIAKIFISSGKYICKYYRSGNATITAFAGSNGVVKDQFNVVVKETVVDSIKFKDNGFVENDLELNIFSDGREYLFEYEAVGHNNGLVNYDSITLVEEDFLLDTVKFDPKAKTLMLQKNEGEGFTEYLTFKVSYDSDEGEVFVKTISVKVNVKKNTTMGMIAVVSNTPYFETEKFIYTNIDGFEAENEEQVVDKLYLNEKYQSLYVRLYRVDENKTRTVVYGASLSTSTGLTVVQIGTGKDSYYEIKLTAKTNAEIKFSYGKEINLSIEYKNPTIEDLYTIEQVSGKDVYIYTYWDTRFERTDTICDAAGNIIGFSEDSNT